MLSILKESHIKGFTWELHTSSCDLKKIHHAGEFSGNPVVRTRHIHSQGPGSIPRQGTKVLKAEWHGQRYKQIKPPY